MALMPQPGAALHAAETVESHQYRYMMGTSIEVQAFGGDEAIRRSAIDEAFEAFADIDRLMSNYRDESELAALNRNASHESVPVSGPMFAVLDAARRVSAASSGAFDITVGPLVRLWGFHDKTPRLGRLSIRAVQSSGYGMSCRCSCERHVFPERDDPQQQQEEDGQHRRDVRWEPPVAGKVPIIERGQPMSEHVGE
jgi:ApbE family